MGWRATVRVLWFSHLVPYPENGLGVLQRSYHLVRELAREHEVHLLAFVQRRVIGELLGDVDAGLRRARAHLSEYCARLEFLPIPSERSRFGRAGLAVRSLTGPHPYTIRWLQSEHARRMAREWNDSTEFDVAHFDTLSLAPYRNIFARCAKSLDHHNIESDMMLRRSRLEKDLLKRLYFRQESARLQLYEQRVCPQFDLNITCSQLDTERLKSVAPGVVASEVPNGVDTDYFRPGEEPKSAALVFAGNLSWYPNASAMLFFAEKVWPAVKAQIPEVTMDVIGSNPPPRLLALAARDRDFRVHGFVPDVRPYVSRAALYVCPIMDGGGTKLKILDALAMGKAIITHPIACEGIAVRDGRDVIFADDAEEFVRSIVTLLGNQPLRTLLSRNARALAESTYSYAVIGRQLIEMFERCRALHRGAHASTMPLAGPCPSGS
jgi:glycosyltransferase involved in cell wall biosynthesis